MRRFVLSLCLALAATTASAAQHGPQVGDLAPAMVGQDADGKPVTLDAWRGKLVVVAFWNTGCAYCLIEVPTLENLQKLVGNEHLQVVVVNFNDSGKDWTRMLHQMRDYSLVQARDPSGAVVSAWGVQMLPNLWLVDPEGRVQRHYEGYLKDDLPGILEDIQRAVQALSRPAPATAPATPAPTP